MIEKELYWWEGVVQLTFRKRSEEWAKRETHESSYQRDCALRASERKPRLSPCLVS